MARMRKTEVIKELNARGIKFDEKTKYNDLCKLLKVALNSGEELSTPENKPAILKARAAKRGDTPAIRDKLQIKLVSKIARRNTFLANSVRDERDAVILNAEIGKRDHKGKIKTITTIKQMEVNKAGFYVTKFIIDLKE